MIKKVFLALTAIFFSLSSLMAQEAKSGIEFFRGTLAEGLAKAGKEGKNLFVDFYATWCVPCKKMEKTVFTRPEVGEYFNKKFVCMQLDAEKPENVESAKLYKVEAFPTMVFIAPDGKMISILSGYHDGEELIKGAKTAVGDIIGVPQLYENYRKDKNNLKLQQEILQAAPQFLMAQEGMEADKWIVRLTKLYKSYIQAKKGPALINKDDYRIILALTGDDLELKEEIVAFINDNLPAWREAVGDAVAYYIAEHNDAEMETLAKAGKTSYQERLERINGTYKAAYDLIPKAKVSIYEKNKLTLNAIYTLYKDKDAKKYIKMMQDYFSKMDGTALPNEYAKAAQELYLALGAKVPQEAHKVSIEWLTNALKGENSITDKINYITMIGDSYKALENYSAAQAQYNLAYAESLQLVDMDMVQQMIQGKLKMRLAELDLLRK